MEDLQDVLVALACGVYDRRDNGVGLPEHIDVENPDTRGFRVVRVLVRQLDGSLHAESKPGAGFTVDFPMKRGTA